MKEEEADRSCVHQGIVNIIANDNKKSSVTRLKLHNFKISITIKFCSISDSHSVYLQDRHHNVKQKLMKHLFTYMWNALQFANKETLTKAHSIVF
ncbi:CLUMA_CG019344, isoform A [Clunio marinus]|uniref:CLUMA_CG019344, isoform A n=1 Tax=Clunio marinus TaxID=568069 RepID=A0A1J1J2E7_9DIPT|nr:CLUMA_CG019344, isoform A [Clunio marinus]